jgi:acetyl esterase/lipase
MTRIHRSLHSIFVIPLVVAMLHTFAAVASADDAEKPADKPIVMLWPGVAPGEKGDIGPERDNTKHKPGAKPGTEIIALTNVTKPMITVFKPAKDQDTGAAVVVCPGGGYGILAYDLEGTEVCQWLNSIGVTGVLLKYRVPGRGKEVFTAPLQDAQRALGIVRHRAQEWGIDPKRVGILGFSAGGHLAAAASTNYETRTYPAVDDADQENCLPDFAILIYPGGLVPKDGSLKLNPEIKVTSHTPPAFISMSHDDPARVENAYAYALALKQAKVSAELHVYPKGGHGYGLRPSANATSTWPKRAGEWLKAQGWLTAK